MTRLGDILVAQGAITRDVLERFAVMPRRVRLGHALRAHTLVRGRALAHALAEKFSLTEIDLNRDPADPDLFQSQRLHHYLTHQYLPYRQSEEVLLIATPEPSHALQTMLEVTYARPIALVVVSARDFAVALARLGGTTLTRRAQLGLRRRYRHLVADRVLLRPQSVGLAVLGSGLLLLGVFFPSASWRTLLIGCNLFYFFTLAFKLQLYLQGCAAQPEKRQQAEALRMAAAAYDGPLPVYTILVPVYREGFAVLARLISHLHALDYPKEKLDIKLICEADDLATIDAIKACRPPENMDIVHVPPSHPRTKPKACNVALQQIRGEYLVIYDAEDAPAPDQLKLAITRFQQLPHQVACLQASLNYYNRDENLLTRLFAIEYSSLFNLLLPALERLQLPIPLGGTSNHMRVEALKRVGGWDAFNVTEDADLGIRLSYFGYQTRMLPSETLEEAPIHLIAWLKQRTRWVKGYIQTWLVYMRDPGALRRQLGPRAYYGFQFFIGAPALTFLLAPVFWLVFIIGAMGLLPTALPPELLGLCGVSFVGGVLSHWLFARKVIRLEGWHRMQGAMLAYPFYWVLHSFAAARALWQLITAPHYWDKTTHGLTRLFKA